MVNDGLPGFRSIMRFVTVRMLANVLSIKYIQFSQLTEETIDDEDFSTNIIKEMDALNYSSGYRSGTGRPTGAATGLCPLSDPMRYL